MPGQQNHRRRCRPPHHLHHSLCPAIVCAARRDDGLPPSLELTRVQRRIALYAAGVKIEMHTLLPGGGRMTTTYYTG